MFGWWFLQPEAVAVRLVYTRAVPMEKVFQIWATTMGKPFVVEFIYRWGYPYIEDLVKAPSS